MEKHQVRGLTDAEKNMAEPITPEISPSPTMVWLQLATSNMCSKAHNLIDMSRGSHSENVVLDKVSH